MLYYTILVHGVSFLVCIDFHGLESINRIRHFYSVAHTPDLTITLMSCLDLTLNHSRNSLNML